MVYHDACLISTSLSRATFKFLPQDVALGVDPGSLRQFSDQRGRRQPRFGRAKIAPPDLLVCVTEDSIDHCFHARFAHEPGYAPRFFVAGRCARIVMIWCLSLNISGHSGDSWMTSISSMVAVRRVPLASIKYAAHRTQIAVVPK
jgi:hypothetical protein